eukprot:scaffold48_cov311-Pinguiococcus_pyrenoidosus.AAC.33
MPECVFSVLCFTFTTRRGGEKAQNNRSLVAAKGFYFAPLHIFTASCAFSWSLSLPFVQPKPTALRCAAVATRCCSGRRMRPQEATRWEELRHFPAFSGAFLTFATTGKQDSTGGDGVRESGANGAERDERRAQRSSLSELRRRGVQLRPPDGRDPHRAHGGIGRLR